MVQNEPENSILTLKPVFISIKKQWPFNTISEKADSCDVKEQFTGYYSRIPPPPHHLPGQSPVLCWWEFYCFITAYHVLFRFSLFV